MAAYVQSGSQSHAEEVAAHIEAGMVYLNRASEDPEAPLAVTKCRATGASGVRLLSASSLKQGCDSRGLMSAEINLNELERIRMKLTQTVKTAFLAIAIAAGTMGAQRALAQQPQADLPKDLMGDTKVIVLSTSDLPGGLVATTFMTEIPPGSSTPRHYHPGQELAYVLEGTGVMHEIGKPSMPIKPGFTVTAYSPPDKAAYVHWASNTSKTDIQRWLITVVTPKGYPMIIPVT